MREGYSSQHTFLILLIIKQRFCSDCTVAKNVNLQRLTINLGRKLAVVKVNIMDSLKESSTLEIAFGAICCSGTLRTLLTANFRIRGDISLIIRRFAARKSFTQIDPKISRLKKLTINKASCTSCNLKLTFNSNNHRQPTQSPVFGCFSWP